MNLSAAQSDTSPQADLPPYHIIGAERSGPVLMVCEHASREIPAQFGELGLSPEHRLSHAAWDIGAEALARELAQGLNAPLLAAGVSRLVVDLNRPTNANDAMPDLVEVIPVPGNRSMAAEERQGRIDKIHRPFHEKLRDLLDTRPAPVLITVHSFTPVWKGTRRSTRIGLLHDADPTLALAMLAQAHDPDTSLNEPYSAADGVTHTLAIHGTSRGIPNVMIEVRNDLLADETAVKCVAKELLTLLVPALEVVT